LIIDLSHAIAQHHTTQGGPTKSLFSFNDHERLSSPFSRNKVDSEDDSDHGEKTSVADTDVSHESGSLTSVD